MKFKPLAGAIILLILINSILAVVAYKKIKTPSTYTPTKIIQVEPTSVPINENTSKLKRAVSDISKSGLESCFNYYNYGTVQVNLSPEKSEYTNKESIKLTGSIVNNNSFPLVHTILYSQLKRINTSTYNQNGHYLIDTFPILAELNLQPHETKHITAEIPVKDLYPQGDYQLQYFILSKYGFHYSGRPFLEEDTAGTTNLTLKTNTVPLLYFDINSVQADGKKRTIRGITEELTAAEIPFDIQFVDTRDTTEPIPVSIKFYNFEETDEAYLVKTQTILVEDTKKPIHIDFLPPKKGAYVLVAKIESPIQSMIKYRFAATSGSEPDPRLNDIGISSFPATKDGRAWMCFHSTANSFTKKTKVTLSLIDNTKNLIEQNSISIPLSPDIMAISVPLEKLSSKNNFSLKAQFEDINNPQDKKEIQIDYTCNMFSESITDFSVRYLKQNPPKLKIEAQNNCGQPIKEGKINNIRILKNNKIQKETTNILTIPYEFSLQDLPAGLYVAQVKIGEQVKEITIDIPTKLNVQKAQPTKPFLLYAALSTIILIVLALIAIIIRFNKKS